MTAGAVLCGGTSRRMGTDKALVEVDGVPMAVRVADALEGGGCRPVAFVGGDVALLDRFGRTTVPDDWPGAGPLGGVLTALRATEDDVVAAACDLPFVDVGSVRALIDAGAGFDVAVARTTRLQPALAWWSQGALERVLELWRGGTRSLLEAIAALSSVEVEVDASVVRNINTPADLAGGTYE